MVRALLAVGVQAASSKQQQQQHLQQKLFLGPNGHNNLTTSLENAQLGNLSRICSVKINNEHNDIGMFFFLSNNRGPSVKVMGTFSNAMSDLTNELT